TPMDLRDQVTLMNVFGSWCAACQVEHPVLLEIATAGEVPIYGLNWADTPERGAEWLRRYENPYARVGNDEGGRVILDFGVTGAPETFVVDKKGVIRFRHAGPVTKDLWEKSLRPLVRQLQAE
ncbi:MAG: DsbE family thiol:disulfide interchange protein, partial [Pseudomonadota bacterium]